MSSVRGNFNGLRESGAYALRDGLERLSKASAAIVRSGMEDVNSDDGFVSDVASDDRSVTVSISDEARRRATGPVRSEDLLGNVLELHRSGVTVASGVAILKTADEMERSALSIGTRRSER